MLFKLIHRKKTTFLRSPQIFGLIPSTHSWEHINMLGEYDFSEKVDFQTFNLDEIFKDGAEI